MKKTIAYKLFTFLNKFCFSDRHDDNCNGCMFKKCSNCPVATSTEKLLKVFF